MIVILYAHKYVFSFFFFAFNILFLLLILFIYTILIERAIYNSMCSNAQVLLPEYLNIHLLSRNFIKHNLVIITWVFYEHKFLWIC